MAIITKAVLQQAKQVISEPAHWTQYEGARDHDGNNVACNSASASCFCIIGAIARVLDEPDWIDVDCVLTDEGFCEPEELYSFNDASSTTHEMVLARFDEMIAKAPEAA